MAKYAVEYILKVPMGGVRLTGGRWKRVFDNNVRFLRDFDTDRMLYWYRVHKGKDAPGAPYAASPFVIESFVMQCVPSPRRNIICKKDRECEIWKKSSP